MALKLHIGMAGPQVGAAENREEEHPAVDDDDEEPGASSGSTLDMDKTSCLNVIEY
jgi:hypothetical protein